MLCLGAFQSGPGFLIVLIRGVALRKGFHGFSIVQCPRSNVAKSDVFAHVGRSLKSEG